MGILLLDDRQSDLKVSPLTLIFLRDGDKVLALKRSFQKKIHPNKWSGFGGKVEPGEELFASARRELLEETGLTVDTLTLKGTFIRLIYGYVNFIYLLVATGHHGQLRKTDEGEIAWRQIPDLLADPNLVDHLKLYLSQILEPNSDFFSAIANEDLSFYVTNHSHFAERGK